LLSVAMTRAKDQLDLVVPHRFYTHQQNRTGDRHVYASRTRFIPDGIARMFDRCIWPQVRADAARSAQPQSTVDIGARMRAMWKRA
jgi:DNA helicase-2/ATP-dependent DNA helicase PcrA